MNSLGRFLSDVKRAHAQTQTLRLNKGGRCSWLGTQCVYIRSKTIRKHLPPDSENCNDKSVNASKLTSTPKMPNLDISR
eukprot:5110138-Amphidinium_carterae.1